MCFTNMHDKTITQYHPLPTILLIHKLTHSFLFKGKLSNQIPKYLNKKHIQLEIFTLMTRSKDYNLFTLNDIYEQLF